MRQAVEQLILEECIDDAQGLPSTFALEPTNDWGMRVASTGDGVKSLYMKQENIPVQPGVTVNRLELIGEDLKSAVINVNAGLMNIQ